MNARLILVHTTMILRTILGTPAFLVPAIVFPSMFYMIFALQFARTSPAIADQMLASYVAFAVMGVALFQFGVAVSAERGRPWERYLRALPIKSWERFFARVIVATIVAGAAGLLVAVLGALFTPVTFTAFQWLLLAVFALAGAIPFVLLGLMMAYIVPAAGAVPVTNIVYLLCAFAGGLWIPPPFLPPFAAAISPYIPTRAYGELLWGIALPGHATTHWILLLAVFSIIFFIVAIAGYRRDERMRYA